MDKRNVSVASVNGYSLDKVIKAKEYLDEIGHNRRTFPIEKLVKMYNDIKGTNEKAGSCSPCAANKFYNGIANYYQYGKLTLINSGKATEADFEKKEEVVVAEPIENAENRIVLGEEEVVEEEVVEDKPKKKSKKANDKD